MEVCPTAENSSTVSSSVVAVGVLAAGGPPKAALVENGHQPPECILHTD
jgi:hypothetical protein